MPIMLCICILSLGDIKSEISAEAESVTVVPFEFFFVIHEYNTYVLVRRLTIPLGIAIGT